MIITTVTVAMSVYKLFNLGHTFGYVPIDTQYFFALLALLLPLCLLVFPIRPTRPGEPTGTDRALFGLDLLLIIASVAVNAYLFYYALDIVNLGWEYGAPAHIQIAGGILWALVLEATRRSAGFVVFLIVLIFSLYPTYGEFLPDPLETFENESFGNTFGYHAISSESILGIPFRAFANLVIGFLMFGVALQHTGGGKFFLNLAFALLGHVRGGPAKVAIFSSGLMGSMSGSVITNVMTTGALSIPAMKRTGFKAHYAAGVEACASTGGVLMPPIMGATAFIMAIYLNVPYSEIIIAAAIPSFLYFFGLFMQIDAYAAENKLEGLPRAELPSVRKVMLEGWYYLFVFALLVFMLIYMKREAQAPFYATALLLIINQFNPKHRLTWARLKQFIYATGCLLAELASLLAAVGLIVGALQATGMTGTLTNDLVYLAGGHPLVLLLMGAVTSFVLGIGMTVTAAYIFLAIILAPALIEAGLDPMSVHMFLLYWGMLSFITPPVALAAFAAASVARSEPMQTGFEAMRIGSIIYFIPFFFVFNPALLGNAGTLEVLVVCGTAVLGILMVAASLQGYLIGIGTLGEGVMSVVARASLFVGGLIFAAPGGDMIGFNHTELSLIALVVATPGIATAFIGGRRRARA